MSLKDFRPLLFAGYEDPLPYALSEISLKDMNVNLWVSLHFNHKKHFEPSPSRLLFFVHRVQFGLYFPPAKRQAIILGDTSGIVVHPFMYFAQLVGCHFYQEPQRVFFLLHLESHVPGYGMGLVQRHD